MTSIKRREFVKQTAQITAGLALSNIVACKRRPEMEENRITAIIPMPIQIVIDDVGWWSGEDGSERQEPYRTGIARNHVPADYQAIADLGKGLGVRPQAATILCEWDRENILRQLPTSTWMREKWDNHKWVGPWLEEAADIIRTNKRHYELTLHGIGHEYWMDKNFTRAEWADKAGRMRPLDQVELHLDFYGQLLDQNQLGPFPKSFVPTAFCHTFGPSEGHETSLAEVIKKRGMNYINTPFYDMYNAQAAQFGLFGIDAGVMTIDRGEDLFDWNIIGAKPEVKIDGPTCGLHWPNLLHADPARNSEIVEGWVKFLAPYNDRIETILAPDSTFFQKQLVHHVCTDAAVNGEFVDLVFGNGQPVPDQIAGYQFILKIKSAFPLQFKGESIKIISNSFIMENDDFLYTINLERISEKMTARIKTIKAV